MIANIVAWLTDPANRSDIVSQILAHLRFSVLAVVIAAVIAVPLGLWIGHTGRGKVVAVTLTGAVRTLGQDRVLEVPVTVKPLGNA